MALFHISCHFSIIVFICDLCFGLATNPWGCHVAMPRMAVTRRNKITAMMTTKQKTRRLRYRMLESKYGIRKKERKKRTLREFHFVWITFHTLRTIYENVCNFESRARPTLHVQEATEMHSRKRNKERKRIPMNFNVFNEINFRKTVIHFAMPCAAQKKNNWFHRSFIVFWKAHRRGVFSFLTPTLIHLISILMCRFNRFWSINKKYPQFFSFFFFFLLSFYILKRILKWKPIILIYLNYTRARDSSMRKHHCTKKSLIILWACARVCVQLSFR